MDGILPSSGSSLKPASGFSRAAMVGPLLAILGIAPVSADGSAAALGDVSGQMVRCFEIICQTIKAARFTNHDVVGTGVMLAHIAKWKEAARAHGELFGSIRPTHTFVRVSEFIKSEWLVEVEADCLARDRALAVGQAR